MDLMAALKARIKTRFKVLHPDESWSQNKSIKNIIYCQSNKDNKTIHIYTNSKCSTYPI